MLSREFLLERGECCGNGCLMCPYEPKHEKGTTNTMNVFCGVYNQIGQLIRQSSEVDGFWCNELLLKHHIENNKIKRAPVDFQVHF